MYGCGCWADGKERESDVSVAVSTSGCGEHLIKTMLAREIAQKMKLKTDIRCTSLNENINQLFLSKTHLVCMFNFVFHLSF